MRSASATTPMSSTTPVTVTLPASCASVTRRGRRATSSRSDAGQRAASLSVPCASSPSPPPLVAGASNALLEQRRQRAVRGAVLVGAKGAASRRIQAARGRILADLVRGGAGRLPYRLVCARGVDDQARGGRAGAAHELRGSGVGRADLGRPQVAGGVEVQDGASLARSGAARSEGHVEGAREQVAPIGRGGRCTGGQPEVARRLSAATGDGVVDDSARVEVGASRAELRGELARRLVHNVHAGDLCARRRVRCLRGRQGTQDAQPHLLRDVARQRRRIGGRDRPARGAVRRADGAQHRVASRSSHDAEASQHRRQDVRLARGVRCAACLRLATARAREQVHSEGARGRGKGKPACRPRG